MAHRKELVEWRHNREMVEGIRAELRWKNAACWSPTEWGWQNGDGRREVLHMPPFCQLNSVWLHFAIAMWLLFCHRHHVCLHSGFSILCASILPSPSSWVDVHWGQNSWSRALPGCVLLGKKDKTCSKGLIWPLRGGWRVLLCCAGSLGGKKPRALLPTSWL